MMVFSLLFFLHESYSYFNYNSMILLAELNNFIKAFALLYWSTNDDRIFLEGLGGGGVIAVSILNTARTFVWKKWKVLHTGMRLGGGPCEKYFYQDCKLRPILSYLWLMNNEVSLGYNTYCDIRDIRL